MSTEETEEAQRFEELVELVMKVTGQPRHLVVAMMRMSGLGESAGDPK